MNYSNIQKNNIITSELPSEACSFNDLFLEELVEGYRTLTTRGRNTLEVTHHLSGKIIGRDGEIDFGSNIPSRLLEITYKLEADTPQELNAKFDVIKNYLRNQGRLEIVFDDDEEFRFFGKLKSITEPTEGSIRVVGIIALICVDPYKYTRVKTFTGGTLSDASLMDYPAKIEKIVVTLSTAATLVKVTNSANANTITVTGAFARGDKITFDFLKTKIYKGLIDITKDLAFESSYFPDMTIKNGNNITVSPTATMLITYRGQRL